jgi:4-amino-4-deoxy-L-arabinose transferase-like glycosyltransferase
VAATGAAQAASFAVVLVAGYIVAALLALALAVAVAVPFHEADAHAYGEWSRLIAEDGGFRYPGISAQTYHRPLYYVLQGWLWGATGFSEVSGRLLSLLFAIVLVGSVAWLAARGRPYAGKAAFAALCLLLVPDFLRGVASGLTDVPLAALVAVVACCLWSERLGPARLPLVVTLSAMAALTKPTALVALAALGAAQMLGPRAELRQRLLTGVVPLVGGSFIALAYHAIQARYLGLGLREFLTSGSTGYYAQLAADSRADALLGFAWLGAELRPVVLFAVAYALLRTAGADHVGSVLVAAPAALVLTLAGGELFADGPPALDSLWRAVALFVVVGALALAAFAPAAVVPGRLWLARLLVFGLPVLAVWGWYGAYETRLSSAAWPALIALCGLVTAASAAGAVQVHPALVVAPVGVLVALALSNWNEVDRLDEAHWSQLRLLGTAVFDHDRTRPIVLPALTETLALMEPEMDADDRLYTADGRFRFFLPARTTQGYPQTCGDLRGYRSFVLLTDEGTQAYMRTIGVPAEPEYWAACKSPKLVQLSDGSEGYALFRVEPRAG